MLIIFRRFEPPAHSHPPSWDWDWDEASERGHHSRSPISSLPFLPFPSLVVPCAVPYRVYLESMYVKSLVIRASDVLRCDLGIRISQDS
jgi:hypothetical protein